MVSLPGDVGQGLSCRRGDRNDFFFSRHIELDLKVSVGGRKTLFIWLGSVFELFFPTALNKVVSVYDTPLEILCLGKSVGEQEKQRLKEECERKEEV